ncbi:MAG TPA: histidinol-phosphate transaminase [Halanaerobiales bacterium]|nr:histidinol-phosphate transaminase [Halanaerobiales bacterium]
MNREGENNKMIIEKLMRNEVKRIKPYIPGKPIKEVKEEYGLENIIKLASNENPLGCSERVREIILSELDNLNRYPDGANRSLRKILSEKLEVSQDMLIPGNGSDGLLKILAESFLTSEDQVIISQPTFVEYLFISHLMGSQLIRVYMDNYHQNLAAIADAVTSNTKMIFLTNPHNPAGTIFRKKEFKEFINSIPDDIIVVVDEAYSEYVCDETYPDTIPYINDGYNIVVLRTFSKAYGLAGLRIGYAITLPEIIEIMTKVRDPFNVNHLAEMAAIAALEDQDFFEETIRANEEGKQYLYGEFEKRNLKYVPTEANFILLDINMDAGKAFKRLLKQGVIVRSGDPLGYPGHLRITIGTLEECKFLMKSIDKILYE